MKKYSVISGLLLLFMHSTASAEDAISGADTAWILTSTALVLFMTLPGLALFYGGLVRSKNVLSVLMQCFAITCVATIVWVFVGYSIAFGDGGAANAFWGGLSRAFLSGMTREAMAGSIPETVFSMFQLTFAIITPALIVGGFAERMRFSAMLMFSAIWLLVVYLPICHWVWGGGWLAELGALDFAGRTVVHVNAGIAALVAARVLGPRKDWGRQAILPHNVPFVLLGAALLWFGWLGFNGGSALAADSAAVLAFVNTMLAPAATLVVWMAIDRRRTGKVTAVGGATAIVVGLVAITPAAGFVGPLAAMLIGAIAAFPSYYAIVRRARTSTDDSLDVAAAHGMGGLVGALLTGVLARAMWGGTDGLLFGNPRQLLIQAVGVLVALAYSGGLSFGLLKLIGLLTPLRPESRLEGIGLDVAQHGEEAYTNGEGAILVLPDDTSSGGASVSIVDRPVGENA